MKKVRKRTSKGMKDSDRDPDAELAGLRLRLEEAEETLRAIREGEVDAVIVSGSRGDRVFSLTESKNMHRLMVETMSEVALASTLDGTIVYSNGSLCDLLLLTPGQTLGRSIFQFVIEQDREDLCTLILRAQTEKAVARLEFQRSDGALVSFHMSATVLDRPEGPLVCFVGTDLRRIEADREMIQQLNEQRELLAASEQRFRSVLENSLDVNYRLNLIT
ncbi:MAG TPA: PAS domain-containing protein, partial [Bacteroidota bacterium]|nr:PAS domain-containing protein [Bacteroidota bacterium]